MGVACLKLEGRMKRPEYVAVITGIYSRLLEENRRPTAAEQDALEQAFSRSGFTDWYWRGKHGAGMFGVRPENASEPKELFDAAKVTIQRRLSSGGGHTGWSRAWIINFYARLLDGDSAGEHLRQLMRQSTVDNLFDMPLMSATQNQLVVSYFYSLLHSYHYYHI